MKLSTYTKNDIEEIEQLFNKVFADSEGKKKGLSIGNLAFDLMINTDPQDIYGFTAVESDQIIGSIFFTKLKFENEVIAFILSPVAIHTNHQGNGIGQTLINFGIDHLRENEVRLLFTYGNPKYYSKVGFSPISENIAKAPLKLTLPFGWLGQSLVSDEIEPITGNSRCVEALNKPEYW